MRRVLIAVMVVIAVIAVWSMFGPGQQPVVNPDWKQPILRVSFIDVGQGESILIQAPAMNVLIDGGDRGKGKIVVDYIREQGIEALDLVIATHPHADHIAGLLDVFEAIEVRRVIDSGKIHTSQTFLNYLQLIDDRDIPFEVANGQTFNMGGHAFLEVLGPVKEYDNLNDSSVVVRVQIGEHASFLFAGDMETQAEHDLIAVKNVYSTVLKIGHHGSRTSTSVEFLEKVKPLVAVITVGEGNRYNHPTDIVLERLKNYDVDVYRTDLHGTIVMETDGVDIRITTEKEPN